MMENFQFILILVLSPLAQGIIKKVKCLFRGGSEARYCSRTTTWRGFLRRTW